MASLEVRVDDWVLTNFKESKVDYFQQNDMPENLVRSLINASKHGTGTGRPDFSILPDVTSSMGTKQKIAVIVENKWGLNKFEKLKSNNDFEMTGKSIKEYAVNGALFYAKSMVESGEFDEVIAIAIAGEGEVSDLKTKIKVFYVYDKDSKPKLVLENPDNFNFLNKDNFQEFYHNDVVLTEEDKHKIMIKTYEELRKTAKLLNVLMNNNAIGTEQRVVYVSGMLLSMKAGLRKDDLQGKDPEHSSYSDGKQIYSHIEEYLNIRKVEKLKQKMMLSIFNVFVSDVSRDKPRIRQMKIKGSKKGMYEEEISLNKEIFNFIYDNVFTLIDEKSHIDTLGEMYSEFLKYALGDGKEIGIVLTPPYVTKLMTKLIEINKDSHLIDLCTGSGGFLVAGMTEMIEQAKESYKFESKELLNSKIENIKKHQLLGVELDLKMFTLASTNMILRGDGSSAIIKGSAFDVTKKGDEENSPLRIFKADRCLLNPPFSYAENGMPFVLTALENMEIGGNLAVIIQDSAGTGKAIKTNQLILRNHTLVGSIKMPSDLFQPNAGVQTSIYIIKAGIPHDYRKKVRFVDFSNDGYKRTGRGLKEIDNPEQKYQEILDVWVSGDSKGDISCIDDVITDNGKDWNYIQHQVFNSEPTEEDFEKTMAEYLQFEISQLLNGGK